MSATTDTMQLEATTANTAKAHNFATRLTQRFADHKIGDEQYYSFSYEVGRKYVRIVVNAHGQRSVYCFIRLEDGAILKADSWKRPAKGVRAWLDQVLANNLEGIDPYTSWLYRRG